MKERAFNEGVMASRCKNTGSWVMADVVRTRWNRCQWVSSRLAYRFSRSGFWIFSSSTITGGQISGKAPSLNDKVLFTDRSHYLNSWLLAHGSTLPRAHQSHWKSADKNCTTSTSATSTSRNISDCDQMSGLYRSSQDKSSRSCNGDRCGQGSFSSPAVTQ